MKQNVSPYECTKAKYLNEKTKQKLMRTAILRLSCVTL